MLARIRKSMQEKDQGFTLIELLVVMIIIGILAAIAIPTFLQQRENGYRSALESDLRNAAMAVESAAVGTNGSYTWLAPADANLETATFTGAEVEFTSSDRVTVTVGTVGTATGYCLEATHRDLTDDSGALETWSFDKADGVPSATGC